MKHAKDLPVVLPLNFALDSVTLASSETMCVAARLNELAWGVAG